MKKRFLAMLLVVCMVLSITPTSTFAEISLQVGEGNVCTRYIHDEKCAYSPLAAQVDCDKNCTNINSDGVIDHAANCVYLPAVAASPCNFDVTGCEICHPKMSKLPMLCSFANRNPCFDKSRGTHCSNGDSCKRNRPIAVGQLCFGQPNSLYRHGVVGRCMTAKLPQLPLGILCGKLQRKHPMWHKNSSAYKTRQSIIFIFI